MDGNFKSIVHHKDKFIRSYQLEYIGTECEWDCIKDKWSYFKVLGILKDPTNIGYLQLSSIFIFVVMLKISKLNVVGSSGLGIIKNGGLN